MKTCAKGYVLERPVSPGKQIGNRSRYSDIFARKFVDKCANLTVETNQRNKRILEQTGTIS